MTWDLASLSDLAGVVHDVIVSIAALAAGLWALLRLRRERSDESALSIDVSVKSDRIDAADEHLVFMAVVLKNVGKTKIEAKHKKVDGLTFKDRGERLHYACSLQVKRVTPCSEVSSRCLDWFKSHSLEGVENISEMNLLSEYENPDKGDRIEFWMEPGEVYCLGKSLMLRAGVYIAKVTFVASKSDEDFWTRMVQFAVPIT
jgi:hypothetical protein